MDEDLQLEITSSVLPREVPVDSSLETIPGDFLADLMGGAKDIGNPSQRDYGSRYAFQKIIGEGGQGIVLSVRDNLLERDVAIKALKAPFEPAREACLEREAKVCGMLEHPNILPTYDLCSDETGSPFFVMKKIEGTDLDEMLKEIHAPDKSASERDFSRRKLLNIFLQVCYAIEYAHSRGVFHLDIKPQNVKLGPFGEVYVLDWGFAVKEDEELRHIAGTPIYIAPERLRGMRPEARSDVYSLGVMLYRMLTGKFPRNVSKITFREYRETLGNLPLIPPRERDRSIPSDLEAIVMKAMADDPEERYESVKQLAADLDRFLDLLPVSAYREGILGRGWKFMRRHRKSAVAAGLISLALLAAGIFSIQNYRTSQRNRQLREAADLALHRQRVRAKARIPLEKASDLVEQRANLIEETETAEKRLALLEPAIMLLGQAIDRDPEYADAYYERGRAYYLGHDMDNALADMRRAYRIDGSYIMAHYWAGKILADVYKRHSEAREEFQAMKAVDPDNEYSELGQARMDLDEGRYETALERCDRIEAVNPAITDFWYIRGLVYQKSEKLYDQEKALRAYDEFISRRRDNPSAFLNRGDIRLHLEDVDGAISDYTDALKINPSYKWALKNRGYALYQFKKKPQEGLADVETALRIDPEYLWAYMDRAAIYEHLKRYGEAEKDYNWAHDLAPQDPSIWYRKGLFYFTQGLLDEADQALSQSIRLSAAKDLPVRIHRRGIVRLAARKYGLATADFDQSIRLRDSGWIYPALMRWLSLKLAGKPIDREDFESHLDAPGEKPWLAALGSHFLGEAKPEEALELAVTPEAKCETRFYLGAKALGEGDREGAALQFRECLKTDVHLYMEYNLAQIMLKGLNTETPAVEADALPQGYKEK
jgi:tetratricopeptide (TPR) repeat protein/tRNA A-37 threonylcarbamoyl transferase component Bud32